MTGGNKEIQRLRSLIFESIARSDTFPALIEKADAAMRLEADTGLAGLRGEFDDASNVILRSGTYGKGEEEIQFAFDSKAKVTSSTATAVSVFGLAPGESVFDRLGNSGRTALEDIIRGRRSLASLTLFTYPNLRPVPVLVTSQGNDSFHAIAIVLRWTDAIAPLLQSGYHLTDAEVDVVELLFRGHQPKDIAQRRERSLETVRTQIRKICTKTDTHGQADIIHLVYGLIATTQSNQAGLAAEAHGNFMLTAPSGRRIDVECTGPDTGRPLLFLHGCLGGRRLPQDALTRLKDRRIVAPGRPGHGQTQADATLSVQDVAQDLFFVLDFFGIGEVDVLTYDLGAPYGLWMSAIQPARIRSLLCLAPVPPLTDWKDVWSLPVETRVFSVLSRLNPSAAHYFALLGGQRILRQGPADFAKIVFASSRFDRRLVERDETAQRLFWHGHAWHVERGPHGFLADAKLSSQPWHQDLPRLQTPPRFLTGAKDRNTPRSGLKTLANQVGAELNVAESSGHSLIHTSPAKWVDLVGA